MRGGGIVVLVSLLGILAGALRLALGGHYGRLVQVVALYGGLGLAVHFGLAWARQLPTKSEQLWGSTPFLLFVPFLMLSGLSVWGWANHDVDGYLATGFSGSRRQQVLGSIALILGGLLWLTARPVVEDGLSILLGGMGAFGIFVGFVGFFGRWLFPPAKPPS